MRSSSALLRGICECIDERAAGHGPARNALVAGNTPELQESLAVRAERVAAVAAKHAVAVDRDSCVPAEAIAAARAERLFGAAIPRELGGEGAGIGDIIDVCYTLGRACASTAMIFAMHQTKIACIVRHGRGSVWHQRLMARIASEQLLLASSTTEGNRGGDLRSSTAAIESHDGRIRLERIATVISYGEVADGIVTTARRSPDAASGDQVLVVFLKSDYTLERKSGWDALGMRGTASSGFKLVASGVSEQVLPAGYDEILARALPFRRPSRRHHQCRRPQGASGRDRGGDQSPSERAHVPRAGPAKSGHGLDRSGRWVLKGEGLIAEKSPNQIALKDDILKLCRETLPRHKVPAAISFVQALKVAATGKLVRRQ